MTTRSHIAKYGPQFRDGRTVTAFAHLRDGHALHSEQLNTLIRKGLAVKEQGRWRCEPSALERFNAVEFNRFAVAGERV